MMSTKQNLKQQYHFADFTEDNYKKLLILAKQKFEFIQFGETSNQPHILLRHDIDYSVHRALRLAEIENDLSIKSTYFLLLHSEFYNLFEQSIVELIKEIHQLGHRLALHYDLSFQPVTDKNKLLKKIEMEKNIIETLFDTELDAISFHNPDFFGCLDDETILGMINAYSAVLKANYKYCSDSNGYWRFDRLQDVIENPDYNKLHILVHPCWWTKDIMSPHARIKTCINGRAKKTLKNYDDLLVKAGRSNIGLNGGGDL